MLNEMTAFITHTTLKTRVGRRIKFGPQISPLRQQVSQNRVLTSNQPQKRSRINTTAATGIPLASRENGSPTEEDVAPLVVKRTISDICQGVIQLSRPLWNGDRRGVAWLWTAATVFLAFAATAYAVILSMTQKFFWNMLSSKNVASFPKLMSMYALIVILGPIILALFEWVKERLALMWRRALTEHLMSGYFDDMNYYKLSIGYGDIDNPDQRISEDIMKFTSRAVRFITVMGVAVFDVIVFSVILYRVYSPLWYLLIGYSTVGTLLIGLNGKKLLKLNRSQIQKEADFRFGLVRVRESTEGIAFYAGEEAEKSELLRRFGAAFVNNLSLLGLRRNVSYISLSFRYYAQVVPTLVIAPQYFAGKVMLGTISQVYFSFNHVLQSLGLVITEFNALAEFGAGVQRLKVMSDTLTAQAPQVEASEIETTLDIDEKSQALVVSGLTVQTPNLPSRALVNNLSMEVSKDKNIVVIGRSGVGKSSLMRAVCGLWRTGKGQIKRPPVENTLFLPQKPFLMLGTLRENIIYPSSRQDVTDEEVANALKQVNLAYLLDRPGGLNASGETLSRRLSLGEQQRLAFARILISRPRLVILDESTSALDLPNENAMYSIMKRMGVTYLSVGNRPSLLSWHDEAVRISEDGAWTTETIQGVRDRLQSESLQV